ncbi:predicted protein, partial [Nematostella vectensis]
LGNLLVLAAIYKKRNLRNIYAVFVVNLALADLVLALFVLPVNISTLIVGEWIFGTAFCDFQSSLSMIVFGVNLYTLTAISINRFVLIMHRLKYQKYFNRKSVTIMITAIWVFSVVTSCGPTFGW